VDLIIDRTKALHDRASPRRCSPWTTTPTALSLHAAAQRRSGAGQRGAGAAQMNEGNNSGRGIGCVSWDGEVYADQFWRHHSFGNVARRPFSEIWTHAGRPLLLQLKDKKNMSGPLCRLQLAGCLRRQFPRAGRSGLRRCVGAGSGLLPDRRRDRPGPCPNL
jgi:MoaA/NifB/PqqE/SkfB family radical SAM enzyme